MTIAQVIEKADLLRPNALPLSMKQEWVSALNGEFAEMMGEEVEEADYNTTELLMQFPRKDVYVLYLCAMIDLAQEEIELYQNDMMQANQAISEARAWYRRNNCPEKDRYRVRRLWY